MKVKTILFLVFCAVSDVASAATIYSGWMNIQLIRVAQNGNFAVTTDSVIDTACPNSGKYFAVKSGEHLVDEDGEARMLAIALSAFASGYLIQTYVDTGTTYCYAKLIEVKKQ